MIANKRWRVEIQIDEYEGTTRASAWLYIHDDETGLVGVGLARLNPADSDVPQIGDELAVARALSELGHKLLEAAAGLLAVSSGFGPGVAGWPAGRGLVDCHRPCWW